MSDILKKIKIPAIVLLVCIGLYFVYTNFIKTDPLISTDKLQSSVDSNSVPAEEQEFLALLLKIQNISIDTRVFDDPIFASLQDNGLAVIDQPKGRRNPFAPIVPGEGGLDDAVVIAPTPTPTPTTTPTLVNTPNR